MISLRAVATTDGDALHAIFTEPGVRRCLFDDALLTREDTQRHVDAACGADGWAIVGDGQTLGLVTLRPSGPDRELIIALSERHWGRGIAFTAAQAAMRHGFERLTLPRILAAVDLPNQRSHRLMERLGFVVTGEAEGPKHRLRTYRAINPAR